MKALVPVLLLAVIAVCVVTIGNILLTSAAMFGKLGPVYVGLSIGLLFTFLALFGSRGGTPEPVRVESDHGQSGHH